MIANVPELTGHEVVSREAWLAASRELADREVALTHALDQLREARRALPWVRIDTDYRFTGPDGEVGLADLFEGRDQLAIQHFMLTPGAEGVCAGCSFISDHVDAARPHFEAAGLSYAAVSRAPISQIEAVRRKMGWTFPWVSSGDGPFSYDFNVSFTEQDREGDGAPFNFGRERIRRSSDMFGVSVFVRPDPAGPIYHSYSTYRRGIELLMGALNWLDLTPRGRNEQGSTHSWLKLHTEY